MNFSDPTAIMFGLYLLAMLFIGFLGYRGTDNLDDYILGGRSLGSFVTALSAGARSTSTTAFCPASRAPSRITRRTTAA